MSPPVLRAFFVDAFDYAYIRRKERKRFGVLPDDRATPPFRPTYQTRRVAPPDGLKSENICRDPKSLINLASKYPTVTQPSTVHALAIWVVWDDHTVLIV
jgi:hypothetical protein